MSRTLFQRALHPTAAVVLLLVLHGVQASAGSAQEQAGVAVVRGTVVAAAQDHLEAVESATVSARLAGRVWHAMTDVQGRFSFEGLAPGTYTLQVTQVGYRSTEVEVVLSGGREVSVEVVLTIQPVALTGVDVRTGAPLDPEVEDEEGADEVLPGAQAGLVAVGALEAGSGMAASGMARMFSSVPGNDPGDPGDVLFMRGSSMDMKVVLLDGAPLYTPFHVSGLLPAFDPGLLSSAKLHNGAVPSEYDGGLTHVLDLRTRPASGGGPSFDGSADLLSARVGARLPLGERSGVALAGRGLHAAAEQLLGSGFPYGYADVVARADLGLGARHSLEATGFLNQESVDLDFGSLANAQGIRPTVSAFPSKAQWGNSALTVGYVGRGDRTTVSVRGALSAYDAELPIQSTLPVFAQGRTDRRRLVGHVRRSFENGFLRVGASIDAIELDYRARRLASDSVPALADVASRGQGSVVAGFVDGATQLSPTVRVGGGLRIANYLGGDGRLAPHASLTWLFGEKAALTLRAGLTDQLTTESDQGVAAALGVDALEDPTVDPNSALIPATSTLLSVARASHVVVSLDQFVSEQTRLGLEGWFRRYTGLGARQPEQLNGSGIDLRIARSGPTFEGWFGYSLSWYWSPEIAAAEPFQGRQLLSAGLTSRIAGEGRASVQLSFGDGLPFTAISAGNEAAPTGFDFEVEQPGREIDSITQASAGNPPLAGGPAGDFLRIDGEVSWTVRRTVGSRSIELRPYVRLLNALNRRDAMFYYFESWRDAEARPLAELSVMPIVGLSWHF